MATDRAPLRAMELTRDTLLGGRVRLDQPAYGYRAAIDPVLLAAATPARPEDLVADLGCGAGAALLCLGARVPECRLIGIELQPALAGLAMRNAAATGLGGRTRIRAADVTRLGTDPSPGSVTRVLTNPPYLAAGTATAAADPGRVVSHVETVDLHAWVVAAHRLLKPRGTLTLIHRADRVDDVLAALHGCFGGVVLVPLWPKAGRPARRILVVARKDAGAPARVLPGLVLHEENGAFTPAARALLEDAQALPL